MQQFFKLFYLDNIRDLCLELTLGRQIILIINTVNGSVVFLHLAPLLFHFLTGQVIILLLECVYLICLSSLVTTFLCFWPVAIFCSVLACKKRIYNDLHLEKVSEWLLFLVQVYLE
jgi:hypothetical protein